MTNPKCKTCDDKTYIYIRTDRLIQSSPQINDCKVYEAASFEKIDCPDCTKLICHQCNMLTTIDSDGKISDGHLCDKHKLPEPDCTNSVYAKCQMCKELYRRSDDFAETYGMHSRCFMNLSKAQQCKVKLDAVLREFDYKLQAEYTWIDLYKNFSSLNLVNNKNSLEYIVLAHEIGTTSDYNGKTEVSE